MISDLCLFCSLCQHQVVGFNTACLPKPQYGQHMLGFIFNILLFSADYLQQNEANTHGLRLSRVQKHKPEWVKYLSKYDAIKHGNGQSD